MLDEKILAVLRGSREGYISGEDLSKSAEISRAAIWKHMEKLRKEGYDIEASPHLGYRLISAPDALIPSEIKWKLKTKIFGREVVSYKKIGSTNDIAYELAEKGMKEGLVIFAEEQAKGKGRHGRTWASPQKTGIYMSCLLRPAMTPNEIPRVTLLAALAVAKSIKRMTSLDARIKWPNDILINGKKVCGILTEMRAEQDRIDFIILGIGVNVNTDMEHLPKGATSLKAEFSHAGRDEKISRVDIARDILTGLEEEYLRLKDKGFEPIIEQWKLMSAILGERIKVVMQDRTFEGLAHTIDPDGALVVRLDSGVLQKVSSGDVVMVR